MQKMYGLIGNPLSHSFSKKYFEQKFLNENLQNCSYSLFEIQEVGMVNNLLSQNTNLVGLNVTIPYKETIIPYLDKLDDSASVVGAVNAIKINKGVLEGHNTDYYGFEQSLFKWLPKDITEIKALVLGSGGASKAVTAVLKANNIYFQIVSRKNSSNNISYSDLQNSTIVSEHNLIINTTPLGMTPNLNQYPAIPYDQISKNHFIFDLIYNPSQSEFLLKAQAQGASIKNGLEMLEFQADKSWEIWTS